jgi:large subunit ribosomal protein L29
VIKSSELQDLDLDGLEQRLVETKQELFNLRFQNGTGQLDNYKRLGELRRDVARLKTAIRERELAADTGNERAGR